tara:strand:+ start:1635 stop:3272 length:1638 start_codon:yes stop_codon:yes gene_type:complete
MSSKKISVCALWRDSESHINRTLNQFEDLEELDFDFEYYFYENDSKDNTSTLLQAWLKDREGILKTETLGATKFGSTHDLERMQLLSDCRNKCKDLLCDTESEYTLLVDSDIIFNKENLLAHFETIKSLDDCVMLTPNVRQNIPDLIQHNSQDSYYDILPFWDSEKKNALGWSNCPFRNGIDIMNWNLGKPIKCFSAFGGFALIKTEVLKKINWSTIGASEHVNFCQEINDYGSIYIDPKNKVYAEVELDYLHLEAFKETAVDRSRKPITIDHEIFTSQNYKKLNSIKNPKEKSKYIKDLFLEKTTTQTEKLKFLKNCFQGEKAVLVSCGPSITEQDEEKLKSILETRLVLSIKQSFDLFSEYVDIHFYNCANYKKYDYSIHKPIVFEASTVYGKLGECDLLFKIPQGMDYDNSLCSHKDLDSWTLEKQPFERCYGPGIEYEIVLFAVEHLGISELVTIGWDNKLINNGDADRQHFYDKNTGSNEQWIQANKVSSSEFSVSKLSTEEEMTSGFIMDFYNWLKSKGCELKIVSEISPAPNEIKTTL